MAEGQTKQRTCLLHLSRCSDRPVAWAGWPAQPGSAVSLAGGPSNLLTCLPLPALVPARTYTAAAGRPAGQRVGVAWPVAGRQVPMRCEMIYRYPPRPRGIIRPRCRPAPGRRYVRRAGAVHGGRMDGIARWPPPLLASATCTAAAPHRPCSLHRTIDLMGKNAPARRRLFAKSQSFEPGRRLPIAPIRHEILHCVRFCFCH
jgi:hypothetical protein